MPALLTVAVALALFAVQRILYSRRWSSGLEASVGFSREAVTEGDGAELVERVANRKRLPVVTLQVKFSVGRGLEFLKAENTVVTDRNYRNDVFCVMGREQVTRRLPLACRRRGYYRVDDVDLISSDLFLSKKLAERRPQEAALYVYPGPVDAARFEVAFRRLMGSLLTRRHSYEDPFEFVGIRPYQPGDPMRDVNWNATARAGQLMVDQHGHTAGERVAVLLDLSSGGGWRYEALREESIRVAAAYVSACSAQGVPVSLATNGSDCVTGEPAGLPAGAGRGHAEEAARRLARLDAGGRLASAEAALRELAGSPGAGRTLYVLVSHEQGDGLAEAFAGLCALSPGSQWVVVAHPDMETRAGAPGGRVVRWEVPYAV